MVWAAISAALGAVMLVAGLPKLGDREGMIRVVRGYELLPPKMATVVGTILPAVEIGLGGTLIADVLPAVSGLIAAALFTTFFGGLTINLMRGRRDLDCGCFAFAVADDHPVQIGWWHSARAAAFTLIAVLVAFGPGDLDVGDRLAGGALGVTVVALVAVALTALSVMNLGRRPVDDYLTDAAIEMRTVSASKY
ncbi:MauE/DoxX family redox-associated membrane protein [Williamsia muralis]|uniref:MauE/DoxX family redox-associated membrane protein n=1 Tax=Williamsia marianensis TaxID=85044 RepID=UPI0037F1BF27